MGADGSYKSHLDREGVERMCQLDPPTPDVGMIRLPKREVGVLGHRRAGFLHGVPVHENLSRQHQRVGSFPRRREPAPDEERIEADLQCVRLMIQEAMSPSRPSPSRAASKAASARSTCSPARRCEAPTP